MRKIMTKIQYSWIILLIITISLSQVGIIHAKEDEDASLDDGYKHVLVINAYHEGLDWTDNQTKAIVESFKAECDKTVIHVEYLDWKRYPNEEHLMRQYELMKYRYSQENIDIIIATDDIGMQFAIDYREEIFGDIPIVFTAVFEESAKKRMKGVDNITGVYEDIDAEGTIEAIMTIHPDLEHIYIVIESTTSGQGVSKQVAEAIEQVGKGITYDELYELSFQEVIELLSNTDEEDEEDDNKDNEFSFKENSAVFIGTYSRDGTGELITGISAIEKLAEVIDIPMYTTYEYLLGDGIVGGSLISGTIQGEVGAKLAKRILNGEDINAIEIGKEKTTYLGFDYNYMKANDIDVRDLPEGSIVINRIESVFETYIREIIIVSLIVIVLLLFILILVVNIVGRRKAELEQKTKHLELMEEQERTYYLAYNDHLTDLPNRLQTEKHSTELMEQSAIDHTKVLLVFIDLDNFNYINTTHGHMVGDILLSDLSKRCKVFLDGQGTMGRVGGDEFVCLKSIEDDFDYDTFISGLLSLFEETVYISDQEVNVSASMGYVVYPDDGDNYDDLLIRADIAMYKMKESGKAKASRFDILMNKEMTDKIKLTNELRQALQKDEFKLVYQPQYNYITKEVVGYEALLRWSNETLGFVPPNIFIPLAESTGIIVELGYWIIKEAAQFVKRIDIEDSSIKISVNISVIQLLRSDFVKQIQQILNEYEIDASSLEFEITESVMIESFDVINQHLKLLTEMGIDIALDDFGTGYSSLTYLKKLPISTLKIDKTFIDDIILEGEEHFFTSSIIDIAHRLGFRVVAEGVEEQLQIDYLRNCKCEIIQGYWFSKPLSVDDALSLK